MSYHCTRGLSSYVPDEYRYSISVPKTLSIASLNTKEGMAIATLKDKIYNEFPFDLAAIQECNNQCSTLSDSIPNMTTLIRDHSQALLYNSDRFVQISTYDGSLCKGLKNAAGCCVNGSDQCHGQSGPDYWGDRIITMVRLFDRSSQKNVIFAGIHGPLNYKGPYNSSGFGDESTNQGTNVIKHIEQFAQEGDQIYLAGDHNSQKNSWMYAILNQRLTLLTPNLHGGSMGIDFIWGGIIRQGTLQKLKFDILTQKQIPAGEWYSDHNAILVTIQD